MSSRLHLALIVSLAVNVFLGAFLVSERAMRPEIRLVHQSETMRGEGGGAGGPGPVALSVQILRRDAPLLLHAEEVREARGRLAQAQRDVHAALTADPFEPEALRRAFDVLRAETEATQEAAQNIVIEMAPSLPPSERLRLIVGPGRMSVHGEDETGH